jgi:hypothetical protein
VDLIVSAGGRLAIHPGLPAGSRELVARRPLDTPWIAGTLDAVSWVSVGSRSGVRVWSDAPSAPSFVDLDGDGADELIRVVRNEGADELHVVDLVGAPSAAGDR